MSRIFCSEENTTSKKSDEMRNDNPVDLKAKAASIWEKEDKKSKEKEEKKKDFR